MPDAAGPTGPGAAARSRHAAPGDGPPRARARAGHRARHRDRSGRLRPLLLGTLLALALAAAVGTAGLLTRPAADAVDGGAGAPAPPPTTAPGTPAAAAGAAPAEWLPAALDPSAGLVASAAVREELVAAGVPAERLRPPEDEVRPGDLLAVTGPPPPGARVVAHLGRAGGDPLLVVDPRPGEPTEEQRRSRLSLGAALLANPTTTVAPPVAAALRSGEVDPRVLGLLAALTAQRGVGVAALPVPPGEAGTSSPARWVLVDAFGGVPVPGDPEATDRLREWLAAQRPPYAPTVLEVTDAGLLVGFPYHSSPDALVADAAR